MRITRVGFISSLLGLVGAAQPKQRKFYITGGKHVSPKDTDCTVSPITCYGISRTDALARSGITVWEAAEYEEGAGAFAAMCKATPGGK